MATRCEASCALRETGKGGSALHFLGNATALRHDAAPPGLRRVVAACVCLPRSLFPRLELGLGPVGPAALLAGLVAQGL
jgi:hypothetical protein